MKDHEQVLREGNTVVVKSSISFKCRSADLIK